MPARHLQKEEELVISSSNEDAKALREAVQDLGDYIPIDIPSNIKPPRLATNGSASWDCRCNQAMMISLHQTCKVDINLQMALSTRLCTLLLSRSRFASEGV